MLGAGTRLGGTLATSLALTLMAVPVAGLAQGPQQEPSEAQLELARSLYYDGLGLMDRSQWVEAADRFERVLAIRDSAVVSFQLALAYSHTSRHIDARGRLRRVLDDPEVSGDMRAAASKLLRTVEAAMGRLTLHLRGDPEGVTILVDGREIPLVALEVPIAVDPGEVHVAIERASEVVAESSVQIGGIGSTEASLELEIPAREPVAAPALLAVEPTPSRRTGPVDFGGTVPPPRDEGDGLLSQWWFWTAVGVVAAGTVVTIVALGADPDPADASSARGDFQPGLLEGRVDVP